MSALSGYGRRVSPSPISALLVIVAALWIGAFVLAATKTGTARTSATDSERVFSA